MCVRERERVCFLECVYVMGEGGEVDVGGAEELFVCVCVCVLEREREETRVSVYI